jgi:RNA polymerase sigma-70 factor (ECF subfamily)
MRLQQILDPHPGEEESSAGDAAIFHSILGQALEAIRGEFQERTWRAFWGVVVEGRSAADVGADLEMRPGTVRVAKSRVLLRLRRELGDISE